MEVINSFFSNIKDKLTNPFFGTLILVLVIHHWELWYAVFNFDSNFTLDDKLIFIENYITKKLTFSSLMWDIAQAVFFMFLGYLIIVATRSIVLWVEFWLMPFITGKIVNKNVVRKSEYDDIVKEREQYFDQYEEQRKNVRDFSKTIDEQTEQIKLKDENLLKQSETISTTVKNLDVVKSKLEISQKENNKKSEQINQLNNNLSDLQKEFDVKVETLEKFDDLIFNIENQKFYSSIDRFPPIVLRKVIELKEDNKWKEFLSVGNYFYYGGSLGGEALNYMVKKDLAFKREIQRSLTPLGKIIWNYRKIFDNEII